MTANTTSTAAGSSDASRLRHEHRGDEQADHEDARAADSPDSGPGPATCDSTQTQSAPGTVSMPASFASWRNGRIAGSTSAMPTPIAVATSGRGSPSASQATKTMSQSGRR